jgi:serine/threonine-protein kinase
LFQDDPDPLLDPPGDSVGSASRPVPMTARRLGGCELLEEIARGGMGVVYRARQLALNRMVAVKVLAGGPFASPGFTRRFQVEARTVARLRHPNIVAIH